MEITKEEVISRFEAVLLQPVEDTAEEVAELKSSFYRIHNEEREAERDRLREEGADLAAFDEQKDPLELRFKELFAKYKDSRNRMLQRKAEEQRANLEAKRKVIAELKELIDQEENIARSFDRFKDLQDKWKSIGTVPADALGDLRKEYMAEVDRFYYNIKINQELKEYDLQKNLEIRNAIVSKLEQLREEERIKDVEFILHAAKEQWAETGPVHKDTYPEIRDRYHSIVRELHKRIQDHYGAIKEEMAQNLAARQAMVAEVAGMAEWCGDTLQKFNVATKRIEELKELWKQLGTVDKKAGNKVWKEFREAQDAFFAAKRSALGEVRETYKEHKDAKEKLIAKAEELKDSTDWKDTTEQLKRIQDQWKKLGSAGPRDDQRLWKTFRAACDKFFENKKEYFDTLDDRLADNLKAKEDFLKELANTKLEGEPDEQRAAIKALIDRWANLGHVPRKDMERIDAAFKKALDALYSRMGLAKDQVRNIRVKDRLERLATDKDGSRQVEREMRQLQQKLKEKESELFKMENNISFFSSSMKGTNPLLEAAQKNIENLKVEVEELRGKLKIFRQYA